MKQALSMAAIGAVLLIQMGCGSPAPSDSAATSDTAATNDAAATSDAVGSSTATDTTAALEAALAGANRTPEYAARDNWRHPLETLTFFGIAPDQTVVEISPGGGWYSEILAPYLRDEGTYIAAGWDPESPVPFIAKAAASYQEKLSASPEFYDKVQVTVFMPPEKAEAAPPGSADLVLTFRNIHNWMPRDSQGPMFAAMYAALKPGGVLGVVEHRGDSSVPQDPKAASGYVNEETAIEMIEAVGFVFEAKAEINANSADTKDHPEGVWTLPPTLRLKDQDRDKYLAIGESDRFTLRFKKPE
jgi:predicted methyltransferase